MTAIQLTSASVHDNLIALINESSQKEVKSQQVTFNDFATNGEDATVIVSAVEGEGYYNGDEYPSGMLLHYSRVHMHRAANTPVWVMDITADTTFAELNTMVATGLSVPHDDIQRMSYDMVSDTERVLDHAVLPMTMTYATVGSGIPMLPYQSVDPGNGSKTLLPTVVSVLVRSVGG